MSGTAARLYEALLAADMSPAMQRRVLDYGRRHSHRLLVSLCAYPDLDPGVDDELGTVVAAPVRAAWLSRPGRSRPVVERALAGERRIAVLEAGASLAGLSSGTYRRLARVDNQRVAAALVGNDAVPSRSALMAARTWGRRASGSASPARLEDLFARRSDLWDALASGSSDPLTLRFAARGPLRQSTLRHAASSIVTALTRPRPHAQRPVTDRWVMDMTAALDAAVHLLEQPGLGGRSRNRLASAVHGFDASASPPTLQRRRTEAVAVASVFASMPDEADLYVAARSCTDDVELAALADAARRSHDRVLAGVVAANGAASPATVATVAGVVDEVVVRGLVLHRSEDAPVAGMLLGRFPQLVDDALLGRLRDPSAVVDALVTVAVQRRVALNPSVASSAHLAPRTVLRLPAGFVAHAPLGPTARGAVIDALADGLGEIDERWEIFEALASSFDGSLAELLEVCDGLTAHDQLRPGPQAPRPALPGAPAPEPGTGALGFATTEFWHFP